MKCKPEGDRFNENRTLSLCLYIGRYCLRGLKDEDILCLISLICNNLQGKKSGESKKKVPFYYVKKQ